MAFGAAARVMPLAAESSRNRRRETLLSIIVENSFTRAHAFREGLANGKNFNLLADTA